MDNTKVIEGINDILSKFENPELLSLAGTVTQGLLRNKLENREEAIEAIIKYSPNATAFLKRKAVNKDSLFFYLHENDIHVKPPITKDKLIDKIIEFWNYTDNENAVLPITFPQIENVHREEPIRRQITHNDIQYEEPLARQTTDNNVASYSEDVATYSEETSIQIQNTEIDSMAEKFTEWFYTMMNQDICMDVEHFFPDANLNIHLISNNLKCSEEALNSTEEVVRLLFKVKQEHNLYFNPNLSKEGTRGKMDPHGLVIIKSCGTLHINNTVSGVFQQMFSLARDPYSENNWKIKNTELVLRSGSDITQQPRLCDNESQSLEIRES